MHGLWLWFQSLYWPETGKGYAFTSSVGSDLGYVSVLGIIWHKLNCHMPRCWRIGRHTVDGTPWCNKHHKQARETQRDLK